MVQEHLSGKFFIIGNYFHLIKKIIRKVNHFSQMSYPEIKEIRDPDYFDI
jgi:hypothetical protein